MQKTGLATKIATNLRMAKDASTKHPYKLCKLYDCKGDVSKRWCIEFYIFSKITNKLERQRIYDGFNHFKTLKERRKAVKEIMDAVNEMLIAGEVIDSVTEELKVNNSLVNVSLHVQTIDIQNASLKEGINYFIKLKNSTNRNKDAGKGEEEAYNSDGAVIAQNTFTSYNTVKNLLFDWLDKNDLSNIRLIDINLDLAEAFFFDYLRKKRAVENKTFNNYLGYLRTILNHLQKRDKTKAIPNPFLEIDYLPVEDSERHTPFTDEQMQMIKATILEKGDHQLFLFISFIYYTATRPEIETRKLQIKDIRQNTIFIPGTRAKNNKGEHIEIPPGLEKLIGEHKLRNYPPDYYVFTSDQKPGPLHVGINYFYKRHRKLLNELGITDPAYTLYGYKHTGAINLYKATKDIKLVQKQLRHSTSMQTDTYLRGLGAIRNEEVSKMPEW